MVTFRKFTAFIVLSLCVLFVNAQNVVLITSGSGKNKEEATNTALRSAIEQTFGTFVSSNTEILNDSIIQDEILTISSGNIETYKYISESITKNERYFVTLEVHIAVGKLIEYTKSKGARTELAGSSFAQNIKLDKLYTKNEMKVLENLRSEIRAILPYAFDYEIQVGSPTEFIKNGIEEYRCKAKIIIKKNENVNKINQIFHSTLNAISLSSMDADNYDKMKGHYPIKIDIGNIGTDMSSDYLSEYGASYSYYLRNGKNTLTSYFMNLEEDIIQSALSFKLKDDITEYVIFDGGADKDYDYQLYISGLGQLRYHYSPTIKNRFVNSADWRLESYYLLAIREDGLRCNTYSYEYSVLNPDVTTFCTVNLTLKYSLEELEKVTNIIVEPLFSR